MLKRVIFLLFVMIALLSCEKDWNNPFDPNSDNFQEFVIDNTSLDFGVAIRYDTTKRETKIYNNTEDKFILLETTSSSPYFKTDSILILGGLYHGYLPEVTDLLYIVTAFNSSGFPTAYYKIKDIYNKNLKIAFTPTEIKSYSGTITVKASYCSYVVNTILGYTYLTLKDIKSIGQKTITVSGTGSTTAVAVDLISVANTDMGIVPKNKQKSQKICITNSTSYPLTITGINYPACFSGADTLSLPANSSDSLEITFSPTEKDKNYRGIVTITSSGNLQDTFSLSGNSNFSGTLFTYDSTEIGTVSKTQNVIIKNSLPYPINITSIVYPSKFSGVSSLSVPASGSAKLKLTYIPTETKDFRDTIKLVTDIGTTEDFEVYGYVQDGEIRFVLVEAGTFQMGYNDTSGWDTISKPVHTVTITKNYYIGKFEITNEEVVKVFNQAKKVVSGLSFSSTSVSYNGNELINLDLDATYYVGLSGIGLSNDTLYVKNGENRFPALGISWYGATAFAEFMNTLSGTTKYRLPTEAEWEFAARGGNKSKGYIYSGSNNIDDVARYHVGGDKKFYKVGSKEPNELGLYDMSGNVCEWVSDWFAEYSSESQIDPTGPSTGTNRVRRNGSITHSKEFSTCFFRYFFLPNYVPPHSGFRIVREVE